MIEEEDENIKESLPKKRGRDLEHMRQMSNGGKLSHLKRKELIKRIESLLLKGVKRSEIYVVIKNEFNIEDIIYVNNYITEGRRNIMRASSTSLEEIKDLHIIHYERIFKYFDEVNYSLGKGKALQYKERLLGHHREDTFVEVNNETNLEVEIEDDTKYDISVLTPKENGRLEYLLYKLDGGVKRMIGKAKKPRRKGKFRRNRSKKE